MYITDLQLTSIKKKFKKITFPNDGLVMINQDLGLMSFGVPSFIKDIYLYLELDSYPKFYKEQCLNCQYYPKECKGIYVLEKPTDCLINPQEVADLWEEDDCIDDCLSLRIPNQTYIINFSNYVIKCYMEMSVLYGLIVFATALPFTNIEIEGTLCFGDNKSDIITDINYGRFSSIPEVFWASEFNHDLALDTLDIQYPNSYTSEYHMELRSFLLEHFNKKKTSKEIIESLKRVISPYTIRFSTADWNSYHSLDNSFYILSLENYIVLLVIDLTCNYLTIFKFKKSIYKSYS